MRLPFLKKRVAQDVLDKVGSINQYQDLIAIKPNRGYVFFSNRFKVDDMYGCLLSFFFRSAPTRNLGAFWGVSLIPQNLPPNVVTINFEQIRRESDDWVTKRFAKMSAVLKNSETSDAQSKIRHSIKEEDFLTVALDHSNGASYLNVEHRILIKAPSEEVLDYTLSLIESTYKDRFSDMVEAEAYPGEQRNELKHLFSPNGVKIGKGSHFTSSEFAGAYSLVTRGLEEDDGEYVGYMTGEVNNPAVLFNTDKYKRHVVVASEEKLSIRGNDLRVSDLWGSKLSQAALLGGKRVVHFILNDANLDEMGPRFDGLTYRLDMNKGDVNPFEVFGDFEDELKLFSAQILKLTKMSDQLFKANPAVMSIASNLLSEIAEQFYVDNGMWVADAKNNRDKIRLVGIPHKDVPRLSMFYSYLKTYELAQERAVAQNDAKLEALTLLRTSFGNLIKINGDLFDTVTSAEIDGAKDGKRVIYDFKGLIDRGAHVAMAQFVNIIAFAVSNLGKGDTVIIHGAELIDEGVKDYIGTQLKRLIGNGGRVVYLYNSNQSAFNDKSFSDYDKADYTVLSKLSDSELISFETVIGREIPFGLRELITKPMSDLCYIRRGYDNVVFRLDLTLGLAGGGVS